MHLGWHVILIFSPSKALDSIILFPHLIQIDIASRGIFWASKGFLAFRSFRGLDWERYRIKRASKQIGDSADRDKKFFLHEMEFSSMLMWCGGVFSAWMIDVDVLLWGEKARFDSE